MREILFRGKKVDNGEWVYGSYAFAPRRKGAFGQIISDLDQERHYIVSKKNCEYWEVIPETVGQYTGLTDKNGVKIFEGDIVRDMVTYSVHLEYVKEGKETQEHAEEYRYYGKVGVVEFCTENVASCGCCVTRFGGTGFKAENIFLDCGEVLGNIHDNPELLEAAK